MKLPTAVICTKCDEVYDSKLYRVCPACSNLQSLRAAIALEVASTPGESSGGKKCK